MASANIEVVNVYRYVYMYAYVLVPVPGMFKCSYPCKTGKIGKGVNSLNASI